MNEQRAIQFLNDVRKPLLALHKAILDHERAAYEREFGAVTPAAFLQVLINGAGYRWIAPLSSIITNIDEALDAKDATEADRIAAAQSVGALFSGEESAPFFERYQALLQSSPDVLQRHGQVAPLLSRLQDA